MEHLLERIGTRYRMLLHASGRVLPTTPSWIGDAMSIAVLSNLCWFFNFPSYDLVFSRGEISSNWPGFFEQVAAPFTDHTHGYTDADHNAKLGFRFVPALLCGALGIRDVGGAVALQTGIGILLHGAIFLFFRQRVQGRAFAFTCALPCCLVAGGHAYNQDLWGFFDGLSFLCLVASTLVRAGWWRVLLLLGAYFTDERAVFASAVLLIPGATHGNKTGDRAPLFALATYAALRLWLGTSLGLRTAPVAFDTLHAQWPLLPYALFHGCEALLMVVGIAAILLWRVSLRWSAALLVCTLAGIALIAVAVIDLERSMGYMLPTLLLVTRTVATRWSPDRAFGLFALVALINACYTDALPLPLQLMRWFLQ